MRELYRKRTKTSEVFAQNAKRSKGAKHRKFFLLKARQVLSKLLLKFPAT